MSGCARDYDIDLHEDKRGNKALPEKASALPLANTDAKLLFFQDLVRVENVDIMHIDLRWQHADILTRSPGLLVQETPTRLREFGG